MPDLPKNVDLQWIGRQLLTMQEEAGVFRAELSILRNDTDILIRLVNRVDSSVTAMREDMKSLWLSQGDLRRRIEALEKSR